MTCPEPTSRLSPLSPASDPTADGSALRSLTSPVPRDNTPPVDVAANLLFVWDQLII